MNMLLDGAVTIFMQCFTHTPSATKPIMRQHGARSRAHPKGYAPFLLHVGDRAHEKTLVFHTQNAISENPCVPRWGTRGFHNMLYETRWKIIMHGAFSVECVLESICMGNRTNTKPQCYGCCIIPFHVCLRLCCVACLFVSTWRCMETHRQREHRYTPSTCSKSFACESPSHDAAGPQACATSTTKQLHAS